ncbi:MAG TPA: NADH-quinone oxidoreductase subunit L [Pirellulales bacterium]|jgi:NADH-quinone oxidoreductase subunit L|nr:NADH-quinone oxidoreductase subunit L [Pirellulales bacterium]
MDTLLISIPALPLAAFLLLAFFGRGFGRLSHWPVVLAFAGSFALSLPLLFSVQAQSSESLNGGQGHIGYEHVYTLWTWADVNNAYTPRPAMANSSSVPVVTEAPHNFTIDVTLRADPLTCFMLCMVTFISTLVAIYASGYMHGDPGYPRFFCYIALFVFSMTMLVSVSNFLLLYTFWEAVGLCSYLLVGFWYEKPAAAAAGMKAFLVNRVGDFGFAIGIFLIWTTYGTLNFHDTQITAVDGAVQQVAGVLGQTRLANPAMFATGGVAVAICLLLMAGACGKSAQFPLHVWLPDAMEGPTPVSALIHAATMVTAGVYMVARCTPLFLASASTPWFTIGGSPVTAQMVVATIGGFTAILAGTIAITQNDLKRVLAYSTISQLGYMFLSLGTGSLLGIVAGMFHLFTHAFFKALLFLGAGSVMHTMGGVIDMRRFGGLRRLMPITCGTFLIGCLALAGLFPFSGFWSKDEILGAVHDKSLHSEGFAHGLYGALYWVGVFTAGLTAFYTFRAFFSTFYGEERIPHEAGHHAHESPRAMTVPLLILAVPAALIGGYYGLTHGILEFLKLTPSLAYQTIAKTAEQPKLEFGISALSTGVVIIGISLAAYLYLGGRSQAEWLGRLLRPLYVLSYGKFFIDQIYQVLIVWPLRILASISYWVDCYVIDALVNFVGAIPAVCGSMLRSLQNGMVQFYALAMMLGLLVLIGALVLWPG